MSRCSCDRFLRDSVGTLSSTKFSLNSCSQSGRSRNSSLHSSSSSSFLFLFPVSVHLFSGFPRNSSCAREIQFQDGEQESVAIVNREDPSVSKTINVYEARMGEKLDSKEMRKRKAKEVQEFDEFKVKMKVVKTEARMTLAKKVWSKWVETRKDPNKPWCELSGLSPREGSTQSK